MAIHIDHVQPGELITAVLINELIDDLEQIDVRVTALEQAGSGTGAVEIDTVSPQPVRAEANLTILGKNFGVSVGATRIYFNGVSPSSLVAGSTDTALICPVPDLPGLVEAGTAVELTVANARSAATASINVQPVLRTQVGDASIIFTGVSPDPTIPGQNADFAFTIHSDALLPATMTITPTLNDSAGTPLAWTRSLLDAAGLPLEGDQITVNPQDTKPFYVQVAIPTGTLGTAFVLKADGAGGGLTASSGDQGLTVGDTATPDSAISDLAPQTVTGGTIDGSTITVPSTGLATLSLETHFTVAPATYDVQVTPAGTPPGGHGWATQLLVPSPGSPSFNVVAADLNQPGPPPFARETIEVVLVAVGSPAPGTGVVTVQRQGQTSKRTYSFNLVLGP
jgi:hypothetical protein